MDKKLKEILQVIFITVIFGASYAAFGNNSSQQQSASTTTIPPQVLYARGAATAQIVKYNPSFTIKSRCSLANLTNSTFEQLGSLFSTLQANDSISSFYHYQSANAIQAMAGSMNANEIYKYIGSVLNNTASSCIEFNDSVTVTLPNAIDFVVNSNNFTLSIPATSRNYTLEIPLSANMSSNVPVLVSALVTLNGTIYGNMNVALK